MLSMMEKVMRMKTVWVKMDEVIQNEKFPCFLNFLNVELNTNENASRHEENRTTATTRDQNMKRKLEVISFAYFSFALVKIFLHSLICTCSLLYCCFRLSKMNWVLFKIHKQWQRMIVYMKTMWHQVETNTKH